MRFLKINGFVGLSKATWVPQSVLSKKLALLQNPGQQFENGSVTQIHTVLPEFLVRTASVLPVVLALVSECFKY